MRADKAGFWGRITLTSAVVNVPIAWTAISAGMPVTTAALSSGVVGAVLAVVWSPRRAQTARS